jgi:gliding motility-associated-like protein
MTLTNSGTTPQNVVYTVTPSFGGCQGAPITYTIIVNPGPVMDPIAPQEICSGDSFTTPMFNSSVSSTIYQWTLTNSSIPSTLTGYPAPNGTGNIIGSVIENVGPSLVTLIYEVLPTSFGCNGVPELFNLTIQPDLQVFFSQANQTICDGSTTNAVALTSNSPNTIINWSVDSVPPGLSGVTSLNGTSNIPAYTLINSTNQPLVLTFTIQAINSIDATICPGDIYTYSITVNPSPIADQVTNQVLCNGSVSTPIQFTGSGTTYEWQNNLPSIGLAANGVDQIPSFTSVNTGTSPITATISATPFFTLNNITCSGSPINFSITVNPSGQVNQIQDITACNGDSVQPINFTSTNTSGTNTFSWVNNNNTTGLVSGGITSGTPAFVAQNNSNQATISAITVTPTFTNLGVSCPGDPMLFNILINPTPQIISSNDTLICNNTAVSISPQTNVPSIFAYQGVPNPLVSGITTNLQNGSVIQDVLVNSSTSPQLVNYTITPISSPQGCVGNQSQIAVTVQPNITMSSPTNYEICSGTLVNSVLSSNIPSTYTWFATNNPNVLGASTFGNTGNIINDILINTSSTPQQVVYTVIPTSIDGECLGSPLIVNVLVYPELEITSLSDETICSGDQLNLLLTANATGTFSWFATNNGNVSGTSTSVQNTNEINDQLSNLTNSVQEVIYNVVITADNQGCTSQNFPITVTVNPTPQLIQESLPTLCAETNVPMYIPNGTYTSFDWTNSNVSNGLPAGGTSSNSIPSFLSQNPNNFPLNSTLTLTPIFETNNVQCTGLPVQIPFTINPNGQVNAISDTEVCNGDAVNEVVFSTQNVLGTTEYSWSNNNLNTGLLLTNGTGSQPSFTATNSTNQPISSLITVISNFTNDGVSCPSSPISYAITVNPSPSIIPIQDVLACNGEPAIIPAFDSPSANGYSWTNSNPTIGLPIAGQNNIPTFTAINNGNSSTQSTVDVTALYNSTTSPLVCLGSTTSFDIIIEPTPFVNAIGNQTLCAGENTLPVTFDGNVSGALYTWTNSNTSVGLTQTSGTAVLPSFMTTNNTSSSIQTIISVSPEINGCSGPEETFVINVSPIPTLTNELSQEVCSGQQSNAVVWSHNIMPFTTESFIWSISSAGPNISGYLTNGIGNLPAMTLVNSGSAAETLSFNIISTVDGCEGIAVTYSIIVLPTPVLNPTNNITLCDGDFFPGQAFSSITPGTNYSWQLMNQNNIPTTISGYPNAGGNGPIPSATIFNSGNEPFTLEYRIVPEIGSCSGAQEIFELTIFPTPEINFNITDQIVCSGSSSLPVLISSNTNNTVIEWSISNLNNGVNGVTSNQGNTIIPSWNLDNLTPFPQTIDIEASATINGVGCNSTSTYSITVLQLPDLIVSDSEICSEEELEIEFSSIQNSDYIWQSIPNPFISGASTNLQTSNSINDILINQTSANQVQQYIITPVLNPFGCLGNPQTIDITVYPLPIADFNILSTCDTDTIWLENLSSSTNSHFWEFGDGAISFEFEPWHLYNTDNGQFQISLTVTDDLSGCKNTTSQLLSIFPPPSFEVDTNILCSLETITFTNTSGNIGNVIWEFGDGQVSYEPLFANHSYPNPGCYDVTLTIIDGNGCDRSTTYEDFVCVLETPTANFVIDNPIQIYSDNEFSFINLSSNAQYYFWEFGDGNTSNAINPVYSYNEDTGFYPITLIAYNEIGCSDTAYGSIQLIEELLVYVPNSFTPNSDGVNDVFIPIIESGIDITTYNLLIFNRWGEVIFESKDIDTGWDGSYDGKIVKDGTYIWKITFNSPDNEEEYEYVGHVNVIK